jgi:hypothetical protein
VGRSSEVVLFAFSDDPDGVTSHAISELQSWTQAQGLASSAPPRAWSLEPTKAPVGKETTGYLFGMADRPPSGYVEILLSEVPKAALPQTPKGTRCIFVTDRQTHYSLHDDDDSSVARIGLTQHPPEMTMTEFGRHWRERHVPLVLRSGPGFRHYSTNIVRVGTVSWHGIAEQRFSSRDTAAEHDRHNRYDKPEVYEDAVKIVAAAEQYWALPAAPNGNDAF